MRRVAPYLLSVYFYFPFSSMISRGAEGGHPKIPQPVMLFCTKGWTTILEP